MSPRSTKAERDGDVAQLGERLNRTQEADGSIPFISTKLLGSFWLHGGDERLRGAACCDRVRTVRLSIAAFATSCDCGYVFDGVAFATSDAPAGGPDSATITEPRPSSRSYVARHWRGELSLARSYWLNAVLVSILLRALIREIGARVLARTDANYARVATIFAVLALTVPLRTWQSVGIWRSASKSRARGWSRAAKVSVCLWLIGGLAQYGHSEIPGLRRAFKQARWIAENGSATFRVLPEYEIDVSGGIGPGFAQQLEKELDGLPTVRRVRVNLDAGGLMEEAKRARALIGSRRLSTEVTEVCVSACTIVFLGGRERVLRSGGLLGFHPPRVPGGGAPSRITFGERITLSGGRGGQR